MRSPATSLAVPLKALFLLLILFASGVSAQKASPDLKGLKGVQLVMVLEHETENRLELTRSRAINVVEEELRNAGIRVLPPPEQVMEIGTLFQRLPKDYAMLYFKVATVAGPRPNDNYAVDMRFDLLDRIRLSRDNSKETLGSIYSGRRLYLSDGKGDAEEALGKLRAMAKEFAADFKAANPRGTAR